MLLPEASAVKLVNDELMVIEIPSHLSFEQKARINDMLAELKLSFKVLLLDGGARVAAPTHEQLRLVHEELSGIRADLRLLIAALADEEEKPEQDLEGNVIGRPRSNHAGERNEL